MKVCRPDSNSNASSKVLVLYVALITEFFRYKDFQFKKNFDEHQEYQEYGKLP